MSLVGNMSLEEARQNLGIRHKVRIEAQVGKRGQAASYLGRTATGTHRIAISTGDGRLPSGTLTAKADLANAIWHELTHALQCERDFGGSVRRFFKDYGRKMSKHFGREMTAEIKLAMQLKDSAAFVAQYRQAPYEAEAYAVGDALQGVSITFEERKAV